MSSGGMTGGDIIAAEPEVDPLFGTKYRSLGVIGEGGMGVAYAAEHREVGTQLVVKVLRSEFADAEQMLDRMRLEAQALGQLEHPNIVSILDFDRLEDGRPFLVLERLRGLTMSQHVRKHGSFSVLEAVHYQRQLLSALGAAHELGVIHRDLKPQNLFLHQQRGASPILKILDFGIAKVLDDKAQPGLRPLAVPTAEGVVIGTPRYLAPEGIRREPLDERSDIYSAGLVLYFMLIGRDPFHDVDGRELLQAHVRRVPPSPRDHASEPLPPELERIIQRALAKAKDERFQTAAEFETALEALGEALRRPAGWLETTVVPDSTLAAALRPPPQAVHRPDAQRSAGAARELADSAPGTTPTAAPKDPPTGETPTGRQRTSQHVVKAIGLGLVLFLVAALFVVVAARWLLLDGPNAR